MNSDSLQQGKAPSRILIFTGAPCILFAAVFTARILWEETFLTLHRGPQMIGFSLAHGQWAILFVSPILLAIWLIFALLTLVIRLFQKRKLSTGYWLTLTAALCVIGLLSIPPSFWQWLLIRTFARSPYAAELMTDDAAEGAVRTVRAYLDLGVPLTATNNDGATAAYAAAAGGSLPVLEMLVARGADLNATNSYGDSPLEAAVENQHTSAANFLRSHGAKQIKGTPEQREAAASAIVRREFEKQHGR